MTEIKRREVKIPFSAEDRKGAFITLEESRKRRTVKPNIIPSEDTSAKDTLIEKGLMDEAGNYTEKALRYSPVTRINFDEFEVAGLLTNCSHILKDNYDEL